jgi:uncharacterized protein (DUF1697 family)
MAGTYVALLRGINVGKAKRVAMADLRAAIESLGYTDVRTLLNSGNAVFTSRTVLRKNAADELRAVLLKKTGVSSRFTLRSAGELDDAVRANPLLDVANDHTRLFTAFIADLEDLARLKPLAKHNETRMLALDRRIHLVPPALESGAREPWEVARGRRHGAKLGDRDEASEAG